MPRTLVTTHVVKASHVQQQQQQQIAVASAATPPSTPSSSAAATSGNVATVMWSAATPSSHRPVNVINKVSNHHLLSDRFCRIV